MGNQVMHSFYEFFAGGGMARAGLKPNWKCLFANDFDHKKSTTYRMNWGDKEIVTGDVRTIKAQDLPGTADLVWGSFPCQDLSLAGAGAGLKGNRSGTFWPFWDVVKDLIADGRAPQIIALENVAGTLHSHGGSDFSAICSALQKAGYRFGAIIIDAVLFVPQSRPRLFIIGLKRESHLPNLVVNSGPTSAWHPRALQTAYENLQPRLKKDWIWWNMPEPPPRTTTFADLIEEVPTGVDWHSKTETKQLLGMMSPLHLQKLKDAKKLSKTTGQRVVGAVYKRTRRDESGFKVQRAEIRFDEVAGCLRTPAGGSSRQLIVVVEGNSVRSRLISTRETARLMGLPDSYTLPKNYNEAYHLTGDGVAVPVVDYIAKNIFLHLVSRHFNAKRNAA